MELSLKALIAKVLAELRSRPTFAVQNFTAVTASASPHGWSATITKTGYTPLMYSMRYGNSGSAMVAAEAMSATTIAGFCNYGGITLYIAVLYVKDS